MLLAVGLWLIWIINIIRHRPLMELHNGFTLPPDPNYTQVFIQYILYDIIKESTKWETRIACEYWVSLRQPDLNETYTELSLSW